MSGTNLWAGRLVDTEAKQRETKDLRTVLEIAAMVNNVDPDRCCFSR